MAPLFSLKNSTTRKVKPGKDNRPQPESLTEGQATQERRELWVLCLLLLIAFALRFPGVVWELPGQLHFFSYHPDELPIIGAAVVVNPADGQFNPNFYNYGTLYIYLIRFLMIFTSSDPANGIGMITMAGRMLSVLTALGTVWLCFKGGRLLGGLKGAIAAGIFVAISPIHVQQSQFLTVDSTAAFFVAAALLMTIGKRPGWSGFASGLAASTKYTAGIVMVAPMTLWMCELYRSKPLLAKTILIIAGAGATGFLLGCPGAILWNQDFMRDFLFEVNHSRTGHGLVFEQTGNGLWYLLRTNLMAAFGWPFALTAFAATLWAIYRRSLKAIAILAFVCALCFILATSEVRFARYLMLLVPAFSLLAAYAVNANPKAVPLFALASLLTVGYTAALQSPLSQMDPRTEAALWIRETASANSTIAFPSVPWFYSPPLSPLFGALSRDQRKQAMEEEEQFSLVAPEEEWDTSVLDQDPDYIVISSFEEDDRKRLDDKAYATFIKMVLSKYRPVKIFGGMPSVSFFSLQKTLPHDMQYLSPRITLYERR